jgi:hypothetical protein
MRVKATLHHPSCQPPGNNSDDDDYEETLTGQVHGVPFEMLAD